MTVFIQKVYSTDKKKSNKSQFCRPLRPASVAEEITRITGPNSICVDAGEDAVAIIDCSLLLVSLLTVCNFPYRDPRII